MTAAAGDIWSGLTHEATTPPSPLSHSCWAVVAGFTVHTDKTYVSIGVTCAESFQHAWANQEKAGWKNHFVTILRFRFCSIWVKIMVWVSNSIIVTSVIATQVRTEKRTLLWPMTLYFTAGWFGQKNWLLATIVLIALCKVLTLFVGCKIFVF